MGVLLQAHLHHFKAWKHLRHWHTNFCWGQKYNTGWQGTVSGVTTAISALIACSRPWELPFAIAFEGEQAEEGSVLQQAVASRLLCLASAWLSSLMSSSLKYSVFINICFPFFYIFSNSCIVFPSLGKRTLLKHCRYLVVYTPHTVLSVSSSENTKPVYTKQYNRLMTILSQEGAQMPYLRQVFQVSWSTCLVLHASTSWAGVGWPAYSSVLEALQGLLWTWTWRFHQLPVSMVLILEAVETYNLFI